MLHILISFRVIFLWNSRSISNWRCVYYVALLFWNPRINAKLVAVVIVSENRRRARSFFGHLRVFPERNLGIWHVCCWILWFEFTLFGLTDCDLGIIFFESIVPAMNVLRRISDVFGLTLPKFRKFILDEFIGWQFIGINGLHFVDLVHDLEKFWFEFRFLLFFTLALKEQFLLQFFHLFCCLFHDDVLLLEHFLPLSKLTRSLLKNFYSGL